MFSGVWMTLQMNLRCDMEVLIYIYEPDKYFKSLKDHFDLVGEEPKAVDEDDDELPPLEW
jgi:hypothetical protein